MSYMTTWRSVGVRRGNVAYCLAFSARTHHLYICTHMSWYRHVLRGTDCWDRGLSCENARWDVPVLGVHIIALRWYFLDSQVLCFFFPSLPVLCREINRSCKAVPSAGPLTTFNSLIICTSICPTFFCA